MVIIAHNIRSAHNVGALLRTAEGLGIEKVYLTGYTPYPRLQGDRRLPHLAEKISESIRKTALGAELMLSWEYIEDVYELIADLSRYQYTLVGLEQTPDSIKLSEFSPPRKLVILLGSEVTGIEPGLIKKMNFCIEIPMKGKKESFNVVEAATMAMYHCVYK